MGMIDRFFSAVFGGGHNALAETVEVFRENAEAGAQRAQDLRAATLGQFAAEFTRPRKGRFDRFIDGVNRLPRPAMALGVLGLMVAAMADPIWFAARMQGIALVPEPLWWLLGAIVSFYFGARHQAKGQAFNRSIADTMARAPEVARNINALQALDAGAGQGPRSAEAFGAGDNPALADWRRGDDG